MKPKDAPADTLGPPNWSEREPPADAVAASYVELTVAIVTIDARLARLERMLGEFLTAFRQYLDSLEEDDATKH